MARRRGFTLVIAPEAVVHLDAIDRKHHRLIEAAIAEQLVHTPLDRTRNRKPLRQPAPFDAAWELRCGPDNRYRIFYEAAAEEREVVVLAIGVKDGNRLLIGGEEFPL